MTNKGITTNGRIPLELIVLLWRGGCHVPDTPFWFCRQDKDYETWDVHTRSGSTHDVEQIRRILLLNPWALLDLGKEPRSKNIIHSLVILLCPQARFGDVFNFCYILI